MFFKGSTSQTKGRREQVEDLFKLFGGQYERALIRDLLDELNDKGRVFDTLFELTSSSSSNSSSFSSLSSSTSSSSSTLVTISPSKSYRNTVLRGIQKDVLQMHQLAIDLQKEYDSLKVEKEKQKERGKEQKGEALDNEGNAFLPSSYFLDTPEAARQSAIYWRKIVNGEFSAMTAEFRMAAAKFREKKGKLGGRTEAGIMSENASIRHKPMIKYASAMAAMSVLKEKNPLIIADVSNTGELIFLGFDSICVGKGGLSPDILTIDFHGLHVKEAKDFLSSVVAFYKNLGNVEKKTGDIAEKTMTMKIVVGKGQKAPGKLGPSLVEYINSELGLHARLGEAVITVRMNVVGAESP